jgi:Ran-binding protein 3
VTTGEEDERTAYHVRAKLYVLHDGNSWKERGTGVLKLNVRAADGGGARLVMRKEAVHALILNVALFSGMSFATAQDPRYIRFSAIEDSATTHYNLRVCSSCCIRSPTRS